MTSVRFISFIAFILVLVTQPAIASLNSLELWMATEQSLNDKGAENAPSREHQQLPAQFRAETGSWFKLSSFWIPEKELRAYSAGDDPLPKSLKTALVRKRNGRIEYRLFVHPQSEKLYSPLTSKYARAEDVDALATASSRSLLVRMPNRSMFFVKLSLDVELGNVRRTISAKETVLSVGVTRYIDHLKPQLSSTFEFIREPLSIIPKGWSKGGQIIRLIPEKILNNETRIIPLFSLTADPENGTILEGMVKAAKQPAHKFFVERFLRPFVKGWVEWALDGHLVMEAHAQNVLFELDKKGYPSGHFFHRDMGGVNIDLKARGIDSKLKSELPVATNLTDDYYQRDTTLTRQQSLGLYFKERFLYNVDRELRRLDPNYQSGTIYRDLWEEVRSELKYYTGMKTENLKDEYLQNHMDEILTLAQKSQRQKIKAQDLCSELFL